MTILRGHLCGEEDDSYGSLGILPGNGRLNKFQGDMKYNVILVKKEKNQEINLKILIRMHKKLGYFNFPRVRRRKEFFMELPHTYKRFMAIFWTNIFKEEL